MSSPQSPNSSSHVLTLVPALELLMSRAGSYKGRGTTFEGEPFDADFELGSKVAGNLIEIRFRAVEISSDQTTPSSVPETAAFHEEATWITPDLITDKLCLWTVSTNTPGVLRHELFEDRSDDFRDRRFVFRLGDPKNRGTFRQEIVLDLMRDKSLEYRYSWGVPHEDFAVRVQAKLLLL